MNTKEMDELLDEVEKKYTAENIKSKYLNQYYTFGDFMDINTHEISLDEAREIMQEQMLASLNEIDYDKYGSLKFIYTHASKFEPGKARIFWWVWTNKKIGD